MIDKLLSYIAPHYCYGCDKIGTVLCEYCKYDILEQAVLACLLCGRLAGRNGVCNGCRSKVSRGWCVAWRTEALERLIDGYKFGRAKAAIRPMADLLDARLPVLPAGTVIVPIPTIATHIRQRGYDHSHVIAKTLAKRRKLTLGPVLERQTNTVQRQASRQQRLKQAQQAFRCTSVLSSEATYLLIDDVVTTGATLAAAAMTLRRSGAKTVWAAATARQPLD